MKKVKAILILAAFAILIATSAAYSDDDITLYAEGIMAADTPEALLDIDDSRIMVEALAGELALSDTEIALYAVQKLALAADKIARRFPGRFNEAGGALFGEDNKIIVYTAIRYR